LDQGVGIAECEECGEEVFGEAWRRGD